MNVGSFGSNLYHWALLAQGRAHFVLTDTVGGFWDIAAFLIVKEAGGCGTDLAGKNPVPGCQVTFGSTGEDHDEIREELSVIYDGYAGFR
jgi:fructose-1,6-bisphosphatase/inositol monophosphatase family enzyme